MENYFRKRFVRFLTPEIPPLIRALLTIPSRPFNLQSPADPQPTMYPQPALQPPISPEPLQRMRTCFSMVRHYMQASRDKYRHISPSEFFLDFPCVHVESTSTFTIPVMSSVYPDFVRMHESWGLKSSLSMRLFALVLARGN
jgi:hypothetical protein